MLYAGGENRNSFVSIALIFLTLIFLQNILKIKLRKETIMKHIKMYTKAIKSIVRSTFETLWAIGTSITASAVLNLST
jgi:hypothetical protein